MKLARSLLLVPFAALALQGCIEMAAVGVGAGVMSAVDRRTTGAQVDDEGIELRSNNRISERFGDRVHVNVTSFNRSVLITGEAPDAKTKDEIEKIVAAVPNARAVTNELTLTGNSTLSNRANDASITGKVKARYLDAGKFNPLHVKVVTERSIVYLLGVVTEQEAADAVEIARTTGGVRKVVKIFDYCKPSDAACAPKK
ncbi:MAG TPA: BON domain-containing protein [Burkholderiales bacterium]|nr:BON domain-containing protein [Burkholderiales bacterium]